MLTPKSSSSSSLVPDARRLILLSILLIWSSQEASGILDRISSLIPDSNFVVSVDTGDRRSAGTDSLVYIRLYDDKGRKSDDIKLNRYMMSDFLKGKTDVFNVPTTSNGDLNQNSYIERIELWKKAVFPFGEDDWYVDKVEVENRATNKRHVFPILRWVLPDSPLNIVELDTSLPQDAIFTDQRRQELERKQQTYVYEQKFPGGGPVQAKTLPPDERFSIVYQSELGVVSARSFLDDELISGRRPSEFDSVDDLESIYTKSFYERPVGVDRWDSDFSFGHKRVAGLNPELIELCTEIPSNFPVTDDLVGSFLDGLTIDQAIVAKRLFKIDLAILEGIRVRDGFTVCSPIALFFLDDNQELKPVAIQLFQTPSADNPIFTPDISPYTWELVKMWYNNAEGQIHEGVSHLGMTHLLVEGIAMATHRQLSPSHPVFKILAPHFIYLMAINSLAVDILLSEDGTIANVMNTGVEGVVDLYTKRYQTWRMDLDGTLPEYLKTRGVDDPSVLPSYPFRDDAILIFKAIKKYATAYVDVYYPTNDILQADTEIQSLAAELVKARDGADGGVGLLGVPGDGSLTDKKQLVDIITSTIFTSSAGHAAVNFVQYDEYGFPLNFPLLIRGTPPTNRTMVATELDLLDASPDLEITLRIMRLGTILTTFASNPIGDFEVQYIFDPRATPIVEEFKRDLTAISEEIDRRNYHRKVPYEYLNPTNVPNAISI